MGADGSSSSSSSIGGVVKYYPFSSERKRAGVVVRLPGRERNRYRLYLKGAPEVVLSLCRTRQVYSSAEENGS